MDTALSAAYETCRRMHRRHDPTYYWATRSLPGDVRPATHALYGYVRTADEIVDGPDRPASPQGRRAALGAWEEQLEGGPAAGRAPEPGGGGGGGRGRWWARSSTPACATTSRSGSCTATCAPCVLTAGRCGSPPGRT